MRVVDWMSGRDWTSRLTSEECECGRFDVVEFTETHQKHDVQIEGVEYVVNGKGHKLQEMLEDA